MRNMQYDLIKRLIIPFILQETYAEKKRKYNIK